MNQAAIKEAAEAFMKVLLDWKEHLWKTVPVYLKDPSEWTQEETAAYHFEMVLLVDHVISPYQPIYQLANKGEIDEPFDFVGYMQANTGRVLIDHLAYPEITEKWHALCRALRGGLSIEEFWQSKNYKERLLPKKMRVAYVPPYDPGASANVALSSKELLELAEKSRQAT